MLCLHHHTGDLSLFFHLLSGQEMFTDGDAKSAAHLGGA